MKINNIKKKKQKTIAHTQFDYEALLPDEIEKIAKDLEKEEQIDSSIKNEYFY